jgi:hypothetical protein
MGRAITAGRACGLAAALAAALTGSGASAKSEYRFIVFFESGGVLENGHAYVGLLGGEKPQILGWHPAIGQKEWSTTTKAGAACGAFRGEVQDDAHLTWSIAKDWPITESQYQAALGEIDRWRTTSKNFSTSNNCSDFTTAVALAGGVLTDKDDPWNSWQHSLTRPGQIES